MSNNEHTQETQQVLPQTQLEAIRYFEDPENCHNFMVSRRWPNGVTCPRCGSQEIGKLSKPRYLWNCKGCKKQFTVKVGTVFEDSPLPLTKWLPCVWLIVNAKNGISSCEIARALGVTQKTAWFMAHRVRTALQAGSFEKLQGTIEADETFIGGKASNMHKHKKAEKIQGRGTVGKAIVLGLLERGDKKEKGKKNKDAKASKVKLEVIQDTQSDTLHAEIRKHVNIGSALYTDAWKAYRGLSPEYAHEFVDHAEAYVQGNVSTNGLENFWSLLKRSIKGTYVSVEPYHLFRYLDEQAYRFNERKGTDSDRFVKAMKSLAGKRLTYEKLTGKDSA